MGNKRWRMARNASKCSAKTSWPRGNAKVGYELGGSSRGESRTPLRFFPDRPTAERIKVRGVGGPWTRGPAKVEGIQTFHASGTAERVFVA